MEYIHIGDILAIPFFLLFTIYFITKKNKTRLEYVLLAFSVCGLFADIWFTYTHVYNEFGIVK